MAQAVLIGVTITAPNNVAVVPLTASNLQTALTLAQTQYATALAALDAAMASVVIIAGGSSVYNSGTHQFVGVPANPPVPTQAQMITLITALNTALTAFLQLTALMAAAQQTSPGINGVTIEIDPTVVPDSPTLSGAFQQALAYVQATGVLPI